MQDLSKWFEALSEVVWNDLKVKIMTAEKRRKGSNKICMCPQCCKLAVREANEALDWIGDELKAPYVRYVYDGTQVRYNTEENFPDEDIDLRWNGPIGRIGT